jgi:hypothetical protein
VPKRHHVRFNREAITQALAAIPGNFEMRLYVDGDFASMQDVDFWMTSGNPHKSRLTGTAKLCAVVGLQPCQYGLRTTCLTFQAATMQALKWSNMKACPITRGEFIAGEIGAKPVHGSKERTI